MTSIRLLKLFILFFAFVCVRYWAIQQIWIPAEEHILTIDRTDCFPDEAIFHAMGKSDYQNIRHILGSEAVHCVTKCCSQSNWLKLGKECHLPLLVHFEHDLLEHQRRARWEELVIGTKNCPVILWKRDEEGNRQKICAVRQRDSDGIIQWETGPCEKWEEKKEIQQ